jgi:hypothetical protein
MGQTYNSIVINTSIDEAWARVRDFHQMGWVAPVVTKLDKVGDPGGTQAGAKRVLNDAFHETLKSVDDENHAVIYSIDDGPGPLARDVVDNYVGQLSLFPITATGQTFVEWKSSWDSNDDSAVSDLCNPIYFGLLEALKSSFE